jgi:AraC-like DNA-binding protein
VLHYNEILPPSCLRDHVRFFWTLEDHDKNQTSRAFRTIADGCPGLIFQSSHEGTFYQANKKLPGIFLYGQFTAHTELQTTGRLSAIGVFFKPNALKAVFGFDAGLLTDSCLDANTIAVKNGTDVQEQLLNAITTTDKVNILSSWLLTLVHKNNKQFDPGVQYAIACIADSKGSIPLKQLQLTLQLSERSLERKFRATVGLTPKLFARICRFQASLQQLRNNKYNELSDIAFENDYADQSHFIRTFKEFAGFSPWEFRKQSPEVGENLSSLIV